MYGEQGFRGTWIKSRQMGFAQYANLFSGDKVSQGPVSCLIHFNYSKTLNLSFDKMVNK